VARAESARIRASAAAARSLLFVREVEGQAVGHWFRLIRWKSCWFQRIVRNMTGDELRDRLAKLGMTFADAARRLGLSAPGLHHQLRGDRPVARQTELLLEVLEDRRRPLYPVYPSSARPPIRPVPPRTSAGPTITDIEAEAISLQSAIDDLNQLAYRHKGLDAELDKSVRAQRPRLQRRLDGPELHQIDAARGEGGMFCFLGGRRSDRAPWAPLETGGNYADPMRARADDNRKR